jgi:hypothetical protein
MLPLGSNLALTQSVVMVAEDTLGSISMPSGMVPTGASGEPLLSINIRRLPNADLPPVPQGAGYSYAGYAYDITPDGASFDPYMTFSITIPVNEWSALKGRNPSIKWYNPDTKLWMDIPTTVNEATRTVSAKITHTSIFALFVTSQSPATATQTQLTTNPTETQTGSGFPLDLIIRIAVLAIIVIAAVFVALHFLRRKEPPAEAPAREDWELKDDITDALSDAVNDQKK